MEGYTHVALLSCYFQGYAYGFRQDQRLLELSSSKIFPNMQFT